MPMLATAAYISVRRGRPAPARHGLFENTIGYAIRPLIKREIGMKAVGIIPARWGSTRFPGKSLAPIAGRPLIEWVVRAALRATRLGGIIVATDDRRIADAAASAGVRAVMTRADHHSGTDRVAEAARGLNADIVVNIQGDEPLLDPKVVDRLVELMESESDWDMATAACPTLDEREIDNPSVVKVVWGDRHRALYFSRSRIPHVRDSGDRASVSAACYWRHIGIYAYRRQFLERIVREPPCLLERLEKLEQLRALHIGARIAVIEAEEAGVGVDTPEDVAYIEQALARRGADRMTECPKSSQSEA